MDTVVARRLLIKLVAVLLGSAFYLTALSVPLGPLPPLGGLLEPFGGFWTVADDAVPVQRQTLRFPGLEAPVEVYRDLHAVPHVFAQGDLDLFRAVGYLQAFDRLFQLEFNRRAATGTLAEVLGPGAPLDTDRFLRSIGLPYAAKISLEAIDPEGLAILEAYALGVNAFIREATPNRLPLEFKLLNYQPRPWEPLDTVAFAKLQGWILSGTFEDLALQLVVDAFGLAAADELFPLVMPLQLPIIPDGASPVSPPPAYVARESQPLSPPSRDGFMDLLAREARIRAELGPFEGRGSNNWAVAPAKSATGRPLLANDPHLGLSLPSVWYQLRLSSPGYNAQGVAFVGAPPVVLGFNEHLAWGATNVGADVVDFYFEQVNETDGTYLHRGVWKPLTVLEEVIPVRGAGPETLEVKITAHGPILTRHGQTVAMRWTGHEPTNELRALLRMGQATNATQFRDALVDLQVPAQNIVYADAAGDIGIVVNGLYPLRPPGFRGRLPADGASGTYDWLGFRPMDQVPEARNPTQGFLVSANQLPTAGNAPYLGWSWADRYRAARIHEVLERTAAVNVEEMKALQLDHVSIAAREFVPFLVAALEAQPDRGASLHARAPASLDLLRAWDYNMGEGGQAPTLYWRWLREYREATFRDEWVEAGLFDIPLPSRTVLENLTKNAPASPWFDDVTTPGVEGRDSIVLSAFVRALDRLEEEWGSIPLWGSFHVIQLRHLTDLDALSSPAEPRPGGPSTVDVAGGRLTEGGRLLVTTGPSWRLIVDVGGPMTAYGVYPGGQSGNPVSRHYLDLFDVWMRGEYRTLTLTTAAEWGARQG